MSDHLDPADHPWIAAPETRAVIAALQAARPDAARFVGGCVRDAVMGRPVSDIDIATPLGPQAVIAALEAAGLKAVATGLAHGTVTAVADGRPFEITTLRRDVSTDGRRATVAFTEDWEADSRRRDFRLNAIYADPEGALFDPQGGVADARAGRVVFIGAPGERIAEDYLRILRFFRFTAWFVDGAPDADGLAACAAHRDGLGRLSAERVWRELAKLLGAPDPRAALSAMADSGVAAEILPEAFALDLIDALVACERLEAWAADPLLRLEALIPRLADLAARVGARLKLSNAEQGRLEGWARTVLDPRALLGADEGAMARALYPCDRQGALDRARLAFALDRAGDREADAQGYRRLIGFIEGWERPSFPVTGGDVLATGVAEGPQVGATLAALEALWVRGGFRAGRTQLLAAIPLVARR
ncbi:MAG: CCA tRNA nucleotidyltransferase [Caulobacterales bacterium]|nr:CCA tRNA nucleotidyltransferase [Caulobacterales bacterium]